MTKSSRLSLYAIVAAVLAAVTAIGSVPAAAGELVYNADAGAFRVPLTTFKELKFRAVIRQKFDFSCGSAALATLLTHSYSRPTKETDVFSDMWEHGDRDKIKNKGFSMLDMQEYLKRQGLKSDGFRSTVDRLAKAGVPGIVLLNHRGYLHFVIFKGVKDGRVLIGDPALGMRAMALEDFTKAWDGVFFVVLSDAHLAKANFNKEADWAVQPQAPRDMATYGTTLSNFLLTLPPANHF